METFAWFESSALSIWVRESPLVFPTLLIAHALGMGLVVGINVLLAWRLFRAGRCVEIDSFVPLVWLGFAASFVSGVLLLAAYPAKALTNPVFYLKIALITIGLILFRILRSPVASTRPACVAAVALLTVWFAAITGGRLLAYTNTVLLASHLF